MKAAIKSEKVSSKRKVNDAFTVKGKGKGTILIVKLLIHCISITPLVIIYMQAFTGHLLGDPVEQLIHFTGIGAFNLLLITLCVSPLAKKFGLHFLMKVRRLLGLYSFFYALLHLSNFLAFDLQFDGALFISEVIKRPYITVGMLAFIMLTMLAITSHSQLKKKMGKQWQSLHNCSYFIVLLVSMHFYWSVKSELTSPLFYAGLTLLILLLRYKKLKNLISSRFSQ